MINRAYKHTQYFTEECGVRIAGTDAVTKASDYIVDFYKGNDIKTEKHEFDVPVCKIVKSDLKANIEGDWQDLEHTAVLFSKATPKGGMELPLVYVGSGSIANLEENDIRGKAVLLSRDGFMRYPDITMYKRLHEYGVAAVIYPSIDSNETVPYVYANFEKRDEDATIPTVLIHFRTARELVRKGVDRIFIELDFDVQMSKCLNTVGIVEGKNPEEIVIVCGHLDSTVDSVGATDDAAAVAIVMEMAKYYKELEKAGEKPERTMMFIAWSGHEPGLHGSKYFLMDHMDIFEKTKFVLNYDIIGNAFCEQVIVGAYNEEVEEKLNQIVADSGYDWATIMAPVMGDVLNFASKEIPHVTLSNNTVGCIHSRYDTLDLVSPSGFKEPILFSLKLLEWLARGGKIDRGYSPSLSAEMKATTEMYGWGLYDLEK